MKLLDLSEHEIVDALKEGSNKVLNDIYEKFAPTAYSILRRINSNLGKMDYDDIFQETITVVWLSIRQGDFEPINFEAYFFQIFRYKTFDYIKKKGLEMSIDTETFIEAKTDSTRDGSGNQSRDTEIEEMKNRKRTFVQRVLAKLKDRDRKLITWSYIEKIGRTKIAALLNLSEGSVKVTRARAVKNYRREYVLLCIEEYNNTKTSRCKRLLIRKFRDNVPPAVLLEEFNLKSVIELRNTIMKCIRRLCGQN